MDEPTTVSELLEKAELQEYCDAFEEEGYDSLSQLRKITENDLVDLIKDVQMKKGHVKRLRAALGLPEVSAAGSSAGPAPAALAPAAPAPAAPGLQHQRLQQRRSLRRKSQEVHSRHFQRPTKKLRPTCTRGSCTCRPPESELDAAKSATRNRMLYRYSRRVARLIQLPIQEKCCITRVTALYN